MLKINVKYQLKNTLIRINIDDTEPKIYAVRGPSGIGKNYCFKYDCRIT
ncbi:Molybdenum transport ATP-binding protein modC [Staphylococcus aureus]|nr:Molybdenum transport ATP-binding protein modC [Staphylococcus aureus]